jgi:hypothetical protein
VLGVPKMTVKGSRSAEEMARGSFCLRTSAGVVVASWVAFGVTLFR